LVVDDSDLARELIVAILSMDKDISVIGEAKDGREAVEKVADLKPDIVTIDVEMPVLNGIEAIERIMAVNAVPILVVTTRGDANTAYTAISKGALDLVMKPDVNLEGAHEFIRKIKLLSKIKVITHIGGKRALRETAAVIKPAVFLEPSDDRVVAVASSTGGPQALSILLPSLPESFPWPVVIAQHNSDGFMPGLVEWLRRISKIKVKVAEDGEALAPGTAYVSPSENHMEIDVIRKIAFRERNPKDIYRPSCNLLLSSIARVYKAKGIGIIMTGMGSDGAAGMKLIKDAGGATIAQDEKSSIVYGMPKVAIESGCIDKILPLDQIAGELMTLAASNAEGKKYVV
jgi:two-component system chemotaxis response regulator CheB